MSVSRKDTTVPVHGLLSDGRHGSARSGEAWGRQCRRIKISLIQKKKRTTSAINPKSFYRNSRNIRDLLSPVWGSADPR